MMLRSINHHLSEESPAYARLRTGEFDLIEETSEEVATRLSIPERAGGVGIYQKKGYKGADFFRRISKMQEFKQVSTPDFEVFYSFSNAVRGETGYGAKNWTARFLYEFLCAKFNGGKYFIDEYLKGDFYMSPAYLELWSAIEDINTDVENSYLDMVDKEGTARPVDLWNKQYGYQKKQAKSVKDKLKFFEREIKADIISQMKSRLPEINWELSEETKDIRARLGLPVDSPGYATGWLINQVSFSVILSDDHNLSFFYSDTYGAKKGWQA